MIIICDCRIGDVRIENILQNTWFQSKPSIAASVNNQTVIIIFKSGLATVGYTISVTMIYRLDTAARRPNSLSQTTNQITFSFSCAIANLHAFLIIFRASYERRYTLYHYYHRWKPPSHARRQHDKLI